MNQHAVMSPFSEQWWMWNIFTFVFVMVTILVAKNSSDSFKVKFSKILAFLFALEIILMQSYYVYMDLWDITESLPLHLCRIMWFGSLFALYKRSQFAFEMLLFVGMVGGFHSLLTPELTHGINTVLLFDYFLVHGGLIAVPMYCLFVFGMRPRKRAWIKAFLYLQVIVLFVGCIDYIFEANYMYLAEKPKVSNPLLIGEWPVYILGLEFAALVHAFIVYIPFYIAKAFKENV